MVQYDRVTSPTKWLLIVVKLLTGLAAFALCLMVVLIVINVIGRYIFRMPLQGTVEIVELALVVTVIFSFAYAELQNSHVSMDEIVARFPRRVRVILIRIMYIAEAAFFFIMGWRCAILSYSYAVPDMRVTDVLEIPIAPLIFVVAVGSVIFGLVLLTRGIYPTHTAEDKDEVI